MTRRARRRLFVLGTAALVGATVPFWMPRLLSAFPAFRVERVEVVGTRYVAPDDVVRLAAISPDASVWDDPAPWEARVEAHPLVRRASIHRRGVRRVEIRVVEDRPVALAATPRLVAVSGDGRVLPLDPLEAALDLPLLHGTARVAEDGRLAAPEHRDLAGLLYRLESYEPAFVQKVSEVRLLAGPAAEVRMLESSHAGRILLPMADPVRALRRVELALGHAGEESDAVPGEGAAPPPRVQVADARFDGQVVLRLAARGEERR